MSETLVAALIGGVFTIVGSIAAVFVQRHINGRAAAPAGHRPPPVASVRDQRGGRNAKAIGALVVAGIGLMSGDPAVGLVTAALAVWLGVRGLAEVIGRAQTGRAYAWAGMGLALLVAFGAVIDLTMQSVVMSPMMISPFYFPY